LASGLDDRDNPSFDTFLTLMTLDIAGAGPAITIPPLPLIHWQVIQVLSPVVTMYLFCLDFNDLAKPIIPYY